MAGIFISYRRDDSGGYAGRLFDMLAARLGERNVFMDVDGIRGGDDYPKVIEEKVSQCGVLLAVIGEHWLTITGADGRPRLAATHDWVRLEIAKALERGVRVIPVLVGKARMPQQMDLPEDLRGLALHQAMDVRDAHFHEDTERLIGVVRGFNQGTSGWRRSGRQMGYAAGLVVVLAGVSLLRYMKPGDSVKQATVVPASSGPTPEASTTDAASPGAVRATVPADRTVRAPVSAPASPRVAGTWKASVTYKDWKGVQKETYTLAVHGTEVTGTATFLGVDHGIYNGTIAGNEVTFATRSGTEYDDKIYQDIHTYTGMVTGDRIQLTMATDGGMDGSRTTDQITAQRVRE